MRVAISKSLKAYIISSSFVGAIEEIVITGELHKLGLGNFPVVTEFTEPGLSVYYEHI